MSDHSWSDAEEAWITEATIALTYTPIDPARLYRWPGHSGLTLDGEQARDGAMRVLVHMQAKGIQIPGASIDWLAQDKNLGNATG